MLRFSMTVLMLSSTMFSQQQSTPAKPAEDMSKMPPAAHAPLFQTPKSVEAGAIADRLTAGLPVAAGPRLAPRNLIDEQIFGKMQRDGIPHSPLATDQEFLRRVMLDLTGRIPAPGEVREFLADTGRTSARGSSTSSSAAPLLWTSGPISTSIWCGRTARCSAASSFSIAWSRTASRRTVRTTTSPAA